MCPPENTKSKSEVDREWGFKEISIMPSEGEYTPTFPAVEMAMRIFPDGFTES